LQRGSPAGHRRPHLEPGHQFRNGPGCPCLRRRTVWHPPALPAEHRHGPPISIGRLSSGFIMECRQRACMNILRSRTPTRPSWPQTQPVKAAPGSRCADGETCDTGRWPKSAAMSWIPLPLHFRAGGPLAGRSVCEARLRRRPRHRPAPSTLGGSHGGPEPNAASREQGTRRVRSINSSGPIRVPLVENRE